MKTTVYISDLLHQEARKIATRKKTTMKALIEEGLRRVIADEHHRKKDFRMRRVTFKGRGLHPDVDGASWEKIREMTYGDRGG
jgi:hypothetical protein